MKLCVYAIYDSKAKAYGQPFYMQYDDMCTRAVINLSMDPTHQFCTNPEDFDLFRLGVFDDENGRFDLMDSPEHMHKVKHLKEQFIAASTTREENKDG